MAGIWTVLQHRLWVLLFGTSGHAGAAWRRDLFTRGRFAVAVVVRYLWKLAFLLRGREPATIDITKGSSAL